jgi:MSHA biogenesis protein MshO
LQIGRYEKGFTLIELIVVIAVTAIVASLVTSLIARSMEMYRDVSRRAELVDAAEGALRRMGRDLRRSLPNGLRVSAGADAIELLHVVDGARYRFDPGFNPSTGQDHSAASDTLEFSADASFNVFGRLGALSFSYGNPLPAGHRIGIYTTGGGVWTDAAAGANPGVITPASTSVTIQDDVDEDQIVLSSAFQFALQSPRRRLYLVDSPVSYICSLGAGTLTRFSAYNVSAAQPTDPSVLPLSAGAADVLANQVSGCSFAYQPGTSERAGLATLELSLANGDEQVRIFQEVHVVNVP